MVHLGGVSVPVRSAAHVFVSDVSSAPIGISSRDVHHLADVLRLRDGETVTASDGRGGWRRCAFRWRGSGSVPCNDSSGEDCVLEPIGQVEMSERPLPLITVGFSLLKGERNEWVVQKLTELGVDKMVPLVANRTVVRWDAQRTRRQMLRLRTVAREAAMQARRVWLPQVCDPGPVSEAAGLLGATPSKIAMLDRSGGSISLAASAAVLVGPEGGWSSEELSMGFHLVAVCGTVLRSETAAISAAAILGGLRSGAILGTRVGEPPQPRVQPERLHPQCDKLS